MNSPKLEALEPCWLGDSGGEIVDGARNQDVVETLVALMARRGKNADGKRHLRAGLFGGLGQGKTSAVRAARTCIDDAMCETYGKDWCLEFDAALYKQDALEHELDRLLMAVRPVWPRLWSWLGPWIFRTFALALVGFLLGILLLYLPANLFGIGPEWARSFLSLGPASATLPIIVLFSLQLSQRFFELFSGTVRGVLGSTLPHWQREQERAAMLGKRQPGTYFCRAPAWLIIDNLDRACEAQQRAVLRALYKHGDDLGCSVLVCMDESRLLATEANPESPQELLRKAIQVEIRMPGRVPIDALRLAWQMAAEAANANKHAAWDGLLRDPRCVAGLARGLVLMEAIGPRAAKRLLNDTMWLHWHLARQRARNRPLPSNIDSTAMVVGEKETDQELAREIGSIYDWLGALRIHLLSQTLPALRNDNLRLVDALTSNRADAFAALAESIDGAQPLLVARVKRIFMATRHWRPRHGDWQPLVALAQLERGRPAQVPMAPTNNAGTFTSRIDMVGDEIPDFRIFDHAWRHVVAVGRGYGLSRIAAFEMDAVTVLRLRGIGQATPQQLAAMAQALLLTAELHCMLSKETAEAVLQVMALAPWGSSIQVTSRSEVASSGPALNVARNLLWPALAARYDIDVALHSQALRDWLLACGPDVRMEIATLLPNSTLGFRDRLAICATPSRSDRLDQVGAGYLFDALSVPESELNLPSDGNCLISDSVLRDWPPINPLSPDLFTQLERQLDVWRTFSSTGSRADAPLPKVLHEILFANVVFLQRVTNSDQDAMAWLKAMRALFAAAGDTPSNWTLGLWHGVVRQLYLLDASTVQRRYFVKRMGVLLRVSAKSFSSSERCLVQMLIAVALGARHLQVASQRIPPETIEAAELTSRYIADRGLTDAIDDTVWDRLFSKWAGQKACFHRQPILLADYDRAEADYLEQRESTMRLARARPRLLCDTALVLDARMRSTSQSLAALRRYAIDAIQMLEKSEQGNDSLANRLRRRLAWVDRLLRWTDFDAFATAMRLSYSRLEGGKQVGRFRDESAYETWLYRRSMMMQLGLDGIADLKQRDQEIQKRITFFLSMAPNLIDEEVRTRCEITLRAKAYRR